MYEKFRTYKERQVGNDGEDIPDPEDDPELASWIREQRRQYKILRQHVSDQKQPPDRSGGTSSSRKSQNLDKDRIAELERLGFRWETGHDVKWRKRFRELCEYKATHGHCIVPVRYAQKPELGRWVMTQRRQYVLLQEGSKTSKMTKERIKLLQSVGFVWVINQESK